MKLHKFLKSGLLVAAASTLLGLAFVTTVKAACVQYDPAGTPTSKTPVFNQFCGVPNGVGNEADFVRVRQNATGNPTTGDNAAYVDSLNSACAVGSKYDVRTYIHNGADPAFNTAEGASAIAHNVVVAQTAKLNQADDNFTFTSKVTASNAASVTDTAKLSCGKNVVLKLVPTSVHVYSKALGWNGAPDSAVNGTLKVGSQVLGSGNVLACWDDRVIVVYEVVVEAVPPQSATCDLLMKLIQTNRSVTVNKDSLKYTLNNGATFRNVSISWGDGNNSNNIALPQSHTYANDGTFTVKASVNVTVDGKDVAVTSANCEQKVTVSEDKVSVCNPETGEIIVVNKEDAGKYKPVGDAACQEVPEVPTTLVDTGAGEILGLFAAVSVAGAVAHRLVWTRRFNG